MPHREVFALDAAQTEAWLPELAELLHACVHGGASIHFVQPFTLEQATAFWRDSTLLGVAGGGRVLLAALVDGELAGSAQLDCGTPPNQPHRAEVCKLLVHPDYRRQGVARALMAELEAQARLRKRSLLTLDTASGDHAEPLYLSLGYQEAGRIPGYAWDGRGEKLQATTLMYKTL
ncbi:GNAT family N-acetyltransferase [Chromobacterium subtsugae]|uniref:GNAT family N-acetyltransferase n=1 Tax=Chromobacterium subtsugae TaxID=251747 RepID=A0ABS7FIV1_9NEIS|nr:MULTISPECIES: GNAT family N-acetyltransferase [Chromobacterium]KUM01939.1 acetyltransferase [Chromobacterium subtsugae]KZE86511.1 acetyltransferase [Chromobacterium sp. F49]MBW7568971.1 GNAT family N-acetyltransferase [Chromobacterium subtsugae]MBW8290016.1 GNAT family N-acetyltransferase [Chromobacterium subtsugae]WSE92973.1 GNAT family N-acetyltransferase [Chromobacterium subtsugae]